MKKLFLFSVALLTSLMVGATIHEVYPNSPQGSDNIRRTLRGDYATINNGDTLRLADGEYTESESITISQAITFIAAEGAKPKVKINKWVIGADFEANGIEFTNIENDYMLRTSTNLDANITLKNCYMHDSSSPFVYLSENNLDGLFIDNCVFSNNTRNEYNVVCASGTITNFEMRNSTIYNIIGKYAVRVKGLTSAVVDHCTFYNCGKTPLAFGETAATNISVSNTTFSNPALVDGDAMIFYNYGAVDNCVYFNTSGCANWMATQTNTINTDPLFTNPTNGDFSFPINSPLAFAATDGSHIGDPRWSVNISGAVDITTQLKIKNQVCGTAKAATDDETLIEFYPSKSNSKDTALWAGWVVNTEALAYKIAAEVTVASGWSLNMFLCDIATGALVNKYEYPSGSSSAISPVDLGTWDLSQVPAGQYLLKVKNNTAWGNIQLKSLSFTSAGGAVINLPGVLPIDKVILSSSSTINEQGYISFSNNNITANFWAKWNVNFEMAGSFKISANVLPNGTSHDFKIALLDAEGTEVQSLSRGNHSTEGVLDYGTLIVSEAGKYSILITNNTQWSSSLFKDVTFTYAGGAVVDIPGTLPVADAILSSGASINEDGYITYHNAGTDNARWNINATKAGSMSVTMDVISAVGNGHTFVLALYDMENNEIGKVKEHGWTDASGTMSLEGTMTIPQAGNYYVVVTNSVGSGSTAVYKDVTFTYTGGGVVTIPRTLLPADAMLSEKAFIDNDTIIFAPRGAEGYTPDGWAKWNVTLEDDTLCSFKANCFKFSGNSMTIKISVIDTENDTIYQKEENVGSSGNSEVSLGSALLEAGDYVIQMQNTVSNSKGRLMSVVVEGSPILVITDDSDIDFSEYAGQTVNVQLQRTFTANMYNPVCLPFAVSNDLFQQIFKSPKSFVLNKATLENQKLFVELAENYGIYQGTPVMVKPTEDVVYPIFENVQINATTPSSTTKGVLRLQGSFASHVIDDPQNALLVGANNTLFFPNDETPYIKSMRAYFILVGQAAGAPIKAACFREPGNAPTWMEVQNAECTVHNGKVIRDGRFVIVREGRIYNALGVEE